MNNQHSKVLVGMYIFENIILKIYEIILNDSGKYVLNEFY